MDNQQETKLYLFKINLTVGSSETIREISLKDKEIVQF